MYTHGIWSMLEQSFSTLRQSSTLNGLSCRFDILQLHSAVVYTKSQGFVVTDYGKPQRSSGAGLSRGQVVLALKTEATVGGPILQPQQVSNFIGWQSHSHRSTWNASITQCRKQFITRRVKCWLNGFKSKTVGKMFDLWCVRHPFIRVYDRCLVAFRSFKARWIIFMMGCWNVLFLKLPFEAGNLRAFLVHTSSFQPPFPSVLHVSLNPSFHPSIVFLEKFN